MDVTLLLVVPDLADAVQGAVSFGDAGVVDDQVDHFARVSLAAWPPVHRQIPMYPVFGIPRKAGYIGTRGTQRR